MNKNEIAVASMTWARNEEEGQLLREALRCLAVEQMPVMITDGGSGVDLIDHLSSFPNFTVLKSTKPGVLAQIKRSLEAASKIGARFILYTESDKKLFFEHGLREFISQAPDEDQIGVILASRSEASFATFPESQRYTETVINQLCAKIIGQEADYSYGPILLNRALLPYLDTLKEDIGWGWRHYIFGLAHRLGYKIVHWVADLPCPPGQQEDSKAELIHRMRQLSQNVQGLVLSATTAVNGQL